jgi:hypothetical protein
VMSHGLGLQHSLECKLAKSYGSGSSRSCVSFGSLVVVVKASLA